MQAIRNLSVHKLTSCPSPPLISNYAMRNNAFHGVSREQQRVKPVSKRLSLVSPGHDFILVSKKLRVVGMQLVGLHNLGFTQYTSDTRFSVS